MLLKITRTKNINLKNQFFNIVSNYSTNLSIKELYKCKTSGEAVNIQGWVKSMRKMKENIFFDVSDGSCNKKLQVLISSTSKTDDLSTGASVKVSGVLNKSLKGDLEVHANSLEVCGKCILSEGYPFAPRKSYAPEYVRKYLHLRTRTHKFASLLRIRHGVQVAISNFLHKNDYIQIHTPILTSNDCEGAGEIFKITVENKNILKEMVKPNIDIEDAYFGKKVFLTVSGQLHLEAAAHGLSKVYTFGPTFRAENSKTRAHLTEFYMLEVETAFTRDLNELLIFVENLVKNITEEVVDQYEEEIKICQEQKVDMSWIKKKFVVLDYEEAVQIIKKNIKEFKVPFIEEKGFSKEHELFLVNHCGLVPTFIINWPKTFKPFYMKECIKDSSKVAAFDLLAPSVGELVGGSLRENDYQKLEKRISHNNNLDWYLDLRKFGNVPTAGFGLGFERYLLFLLGINNIKDAIPFPRWPHNCNL